MLDESFYQKADEIIANHTKEERSLIPIIQDIQAEYRYLPPELLTYVAKEIGITDARAYSVASFYENFSFEPKENTFSKSVTGQLVTFGNPPRSWNVFAATSVLRKDARLPMICCSRWRPSPAWVHADWLLS